nr:unnamed protein product [Callosobruchus analis]
MVITREIREEIKHSVSTSITSLLKDDEFIVRIVQKVSDGVIKTVEDRLSRLEEKVNRLTDNTRSTVIQDLKAEVNALKSENDYLLKKQDELDQAKRSNNLRFFQVAEKENENNLISDVTRLIESHLGIKLQDSEIVTCYRIGKKNANKSRGILVTFSNSRIKQLIYNAKKKLKGSGIVIKEDLTGTRFRLMEAAIEKTSVKSVWSYFGNIYVLKNGKRFVIRSDSDLQKL